MAHGHRRRTAAERRGPRAIAAIAVAVVAAAAMLGPAEARERERSGEPASQAGDGSMHLAQAEEGAGQPLPPSPDTTADAAYGSAVDLSADGRVAVVGAPLDGEGEGEGDEGGPGSATVFLDTGNGWVEVVRLVAPDGAPGDAFGAAVAVDGDGRTVAVGAPGADEGAGQVLVFSAPEWSPEAAQVLPTPGQDAFGTSVDLDAAGDTLVVGSPGTGEEAGSAWLYEGPDFLENPIVELGHEGRAGDRFGEAVAVSGDGGRAAVGSPAWGLEGDEGGAAFVYFGPDFLESLGARPPEPLPGDAVGTSVALDGDGGVLVVGAPGTGDGAGAAWRFLGDDGYAGETAAMLLVEAAPGDAVGAAVAVGRTGSTVLVGAPGVPAAYLLRGDPDPAEAEPETLPPGPHGLALALGGDEPVCLLGTSPGASPSPSSGLVLAGVVPGSAGSASFCRLGGNIAGTVLAEIDPDPAEGGEPLRDVMVRLHVVLGNGQRGNRLFVPQWLDSNGRFAFFVPPGTYDVVAEAAPWYFSVDEASQRVTVPPGDTNMQLLLPKVPLASGGTLIEPALPSAQSGVLEVPAGAEPAVAFQACEGGTGTWQVVSRDGNALGGALARGPLTESGQYPGRYTARIPAFSDRVEEVAVLFDVACPDGSVESARLDTFIDPSGIIRDLFGDPVAGALVVLRRSEDEEGPFVTVPDGSTVMSPANRANPTLTDEAGFYRWDVVPGFYVVRAMADGCHAPGRPDRPYVESAVLPVPPPQVDIDLVLDCGAPRPLETRSVERACPPDVPEDGFTDVPAGNVHEASVDCVTWWEIARGVTDDRFGPDLPTTRAQMASFLARLFAAAGQPLPDGPDAFPDDDGSVHEPAIDALAQAGVVQGRPDGTYAPLEPVTRGQMATFLTRTVERLLATSLFASRDAFSDDDGTVHEPAIDKMAQAGVTGGRAPGVYAPGDTTRRDQMTSFIARTLDALLEEGAATLPAARA